MRRRILMLLLSAVMVISLTACSKNGSNEPAGKQEDVQPTSQPEATKPVDEENIGNRGGAESKCR